MKSAGRVLIALGVAFGLVIPVAAPSQANEGDVHSMDVISSHMWAQPPYGSYSLRELSVMAVNNSGFSLTNSAVNVTYFDSAHQQIGSPRWTYYDMLSVVAPGEVLAFMTSPPREAAYYTVNAVAGLETTRHANRNFRLNSKELGPPDSQGYRWYHASVTNLNRTAASRVAMQVICYNSDGISTFSGPTFPEDLAPGATTSLGHQIGPDDPACTGPSYVTIDAESEPSVPVGPPSAPSGVTATAIGGPGSGLVNVTWNAPADTGGLGVTQYEVTSSPGSSGCTTVGAQSCIVRGLRGGTSYVFAVRARNSLYVGEFSGQSASVTPAPAPPKPPVTKPVPKKPSRVARATITYPRHGQARLALIPGYLGYPAQVVYKIRITGKNNNKYGPEVSTSWPVYYFNGITKGAVYRVQIVVANKTGRSAPVTIVLKSNK